MIVLAKIMEHVTISRMATLVTVPWSLQARAVKVGLNVTESITACQVASYLLHKYT